MDTGKCERCKGPNNGARLCIRCDDWETVLGRLIKLGLNQENTVVHREVNKLAMEAYYEGRFPPQFSGKF